MSNCGLLSSDLNFSILADCLLCSDAGSTRTGDVLGACCQWLSRIPRPGPPLPGREPGELPGGLVDSTKMIGRRHNFPHTLRNWYDPLYSSQHFIMSEDEEEKERVIEQIWEQSSRFGRLEKLTIPSGWRQDKDVALAAVSSRGSNLQFFVKKFRDDKEVVMKAVELRR